MGFALGTFSWAMKDMKENEMKMDEITHWCEKTEAESTKTVWPEYDAQGIYLCRVCEDCEEVKLSCYRPEILTGYGQADVDEPIEAENDRALLRAMS